MNFEKQSTSLILAYLILLFHFEKIQAKHVFPGFTVSSSVDDMEVAAAQPRPVVINSVMDPQVLPLVADSSELGDIEVSASSEVVQKILRHPRAFSYNEKDQVQEATIQEINPDQETSALDYFKYLKKVEAANSQEGGGKLDSSEALSEEKESDEDYLIHKKIKNDSGADQDNLKTDESRDDNSHEAYEVQEKKEKGGSDGDSHQGDNHGRHGGKEGDSKQEASGDGGEVEYMPNVT